MKKSISPEQYKLFGFLSKGNTLKYQQGGDVSSLGFRDDSPYRNSSQLNITTENGIIDMSQTGIPLIAQDNTGMKKFLRPYSGQHQFRGNQVLETPLMQQGGSPHYNLQNNVKYGYPNKLDSMLYKSVFDDASKGNITPTENIDFLKSLNRPQDLDLINSYNAQQDALEQNKNMFRKKLNLNLALKAHAKTLGIYQNGGRLVTSVPQGYIPLEGKLNYWHNPQSSASYGEGNGTKMSNEEWTNFLNSPKGQAWKQNQASNTDDVIYTQQSTPIPVKSFDGQMIYDDKKHATGMYRWQDRNTNDNTQAGQGHNGNVEWTDVDMYGKPKGDVFTIPSSIFSNKIVKGVNTLYDRNLLDSYRTEQVKLKNGGNIMNKYQNGGSIPIGSKFIKNTSPYFADVTYPGDTLTNNQLKAAALQRYFNGTLTNQIIAGQDKGPIFNKTYNYNLSPKDLAKLPAIDDNQGIGDYIPALFRNTDKLPAPMKDKPKEQWFNGMRLQPDGSYKQFGGTYQNRSYQQGGNVNLPYHPLTNPIGYKSKPNLQGLIPKTFATPHYNASSRVQYINSMQLDKLKDVPKNFKRTKNSWNDFAPVKMGNTTSDSSWYKNYFDEYMTGRIKPQLKKAYDEGKNLEGWSNGFSGDDAFNINEVYLRKAAYDAKKQTNYVDQNDLRLKTSYEQGGIVNPFRPSFSGGGPFEGKPKYIIPIDPTQLDVNVGTMLDNRIKEGIMPTATSVSSKDEYVNKAYNGVSIVDYLASLKKETSQTDRKVLAEENGITDYHGTAAQNTQLLNLLRGTPNEATGILNKTVTSTFRGVSPKVSSNHPSNPNSVTGYKVAVGNDPNAVIFSNNRIKSGVYGMGTKDANGHVKWDNQSNQGNQPNDGSQSSLSTPRQMTDNEKYNYQELDANGNATYPYRDKLNFAQKLQTEYNNGKTFLSTTNKDNPVLKMIDAVATPLVHSGTSLAKIATGKANGWDVLDAALTVAPAVGRTMKFIKPLLGELKFSEQAIQNLRSSALNKLLETNSLSKERLAELVKTGKINQNLKDFERTLMQEASATPKPLPKNTVTYESAINNREASQGLKRIAEEKELLRLNKINNNLNKMGITSKPVPKSLQAKYLNMNKRLANMEAAYQLGGLFRK